LPKLSEGQFRCAVKYARAGRQRDAGACFLVKRKSRDMFEIPCNPVQRRLCNAQIAGGCRKAAVARHCHKGPQLLGRHGQIKGRIPVRSGTLGRLQTPRGKDRQGPVHATGHRVTGGGWRHAFSPPQEQFRAKGGFQFCNALGDGGLRQKGKLRCRRDAASLMNGLEGAQMAQVQSVGAHRAIYSFFEYQ